MNRDRIHPSYERFVIEISDKLSDKQYNKLMNEGDYSDDESFLFNNMDNEDFYIEYNLRIKRGTIKNVLLKAQELRLKLSVLNRRLLKVKAENRRLRKLLDGLKSIEIED